MPTDPSDLAARLRAVLDYLKVNLWEEPVDCALVTRVLKEAEMVLLPILEAREAAIRSEGQTCATCQHWTPQADISGRIPPTFGTCQHPLVYRGYDGTERVEDDPALRVIVEGDEGWGWATAPTFGCTLHSPLPASPRPEGR